MQAMQQNGGNPAQVLYQCYDRNSNKFRPFKQPPGQPQPFPKIQRLNEDVESNAQVALQMSIKSQRTSQPQTPWAVQYNNLSNRQDGASDAASVFSDVKSRRSFAASIRSKAVDALSVKDLPVEDKMSRIAASIKEQQQEGPSGENVTNPPPENQPNDQEAQDEQAELYDEINSLYNMDNPKGDDPDERKSQFSS